jgi:hypothetical protein
LAGLPASRFSALFPKKELRENRDFCFAFKLICPVQILCKKYFGFPLTQITHISPDRLVPSEGRLAIVTKRGTGCGGRGSVVARLWRADERREAYGEVVWS